MSTLWFPFVLLGLLAIFAGSSVALADETNISSIQIEQKPKQVSSSYGQLFTLQAGSFAPDNLQLDNGSYVFNYGNSETQPGKLISGRVRLGAEALRAERRDYLEEGTWPSRCFTGGRRRFRICRSCRERRTRSICWGSTRVSCTPRPGFPGSCSSRSPTRDFSTPSTSSPVRRVSSQPRAVSETLWQAWERASGSMESTRSRGDSVFSHGEAQPDLSP